MSAPTLTEFLLARIAEMEGASDLLVDGEVEWIGGRIINPHAMLLADCEAKRRIVDLCDQYEHGRGRMWEILTSLAAVYSDHPDYDEAWRP